MYVVQQLLYVVTILVVRCYCTAAMLNRELNNYCMLLQYLLFAVTALPTTIVCSYNTCTLNPRNCFPWITTSIFVRDLWNLSHRMRLGILHWNMWKKIFGQKSSYDSCTLGQRYNVSEELPSGIYILQEIETCFVDRWMLGRLFRRDIILSTSRPATISCIPP